MGSSGQGGTGGDPGPSRVQGDRRRAGPLVVLRGWLGLVSALAALVVIVLGVRYAGEGAPGRVDARVQDGLYGVEPPWRHLARTLDALGEPAGAGSLGFAAVSCCLLFRRPRDAVFAAVGMGLPVVAATLLKHVVGRTIHGAENLSYPSGHTAFLTAVALVVALLARGPRALPVLAAAVAAGAAMGWAQVALGAHYPTDALAGWCTALALVPPAGWLVDRAAGRPAGRSADDVRPERS
ncbi:phosphatase PAP2 family protein [Kitasatospora sp. NPDC127059]|uniref:phosphatase PAP2 family protein n=1 Tax=unclassified Kitasatospora TaxID=2633591 RepID=UPI0036696D6E